MAVSKQYFWSKLILILRIESYKNANNNYSGSLLVVMDIYSNFNFLNCKNQMLNMQLINTLLAAFLEIKFLIY